MTGNGRAGNRRRSWAINLALVLISMALMLLVMEVGLRVLWTSLSPSLRALVQYRYPDGTGTLDFVAWMSDPEIGARLRPNLDVVITDHVDAGPYLLRTNSLGMRDDEPDETVDVAVVGDSFTFGYGVPVEDGWAARFEANTGLDTLNLAYIGWSSTQYPLALARFGLPRQPRLVLWTFFLNDVFESINVQNWRDSGNPDYLAWLEETVGTVRGRVPEGAGADLHFPYTLRLWQVVSVLVRPPEMAAPEQVAEDRVRVAHEGLTLEFVPNFFARVTPDNPDAQPGWDLTWQALLETQAMLGDVPLVVIYVPLKEQVYWSLLEPELSDPSRYRFDESRDYLADFCARHDIPFIDLTGPMQAVVGHGEQVYFELDGHWNAAGHALAATLIEAALRDFGLLP